MIQSTILTYGRIHFRDENRLGRKTPLPTENSSDKNPVKDEFSVLNLSVYFSLQTDAKIGREFRRRRKTVLIHIRRENQDDFFALAPNEKSGTRKPATLSG